MKHDDNVLAKDAMAVLEKYEAPAIGGGMSNLYILAVNNVVNSLGYVLKKQAEPDLDCFEPADFIARNRLLPHSLTGDMRLMSDATVDEVKRVRQELIACDKREDIDDSAKTVGQFKQALRDTKAFITSDTSMGHFYKEAIEQSISVIEKWQEGKLHLEKKRRIPVKDQQRF